MSNIGKPEHFAVALLAENPSARRQFLDETLRNYSRPAGPLRSLTMDRELSAQLAGVGEARILVVLDAHAGYDAICDFLEGLFRGFPDNARAEILICSPVFMSFGRGLAPRLTPQVGMTTGELEELTDSYRAGEFFFRMLINYRFAIVVNDDFLGIIVDQFLAMSGPLPLDADEARGWRGDVGRFWDAVDGLIRETFREFYPGLEAGAFVNTLGRLYQLGHREQGRADLLLKGLSEGRHWLASGGAYNMKRRLIRIERRALSMAMDQAAEDQGQDRPLFSPHRQSRYAAVRNMLIARMRMYDDLRDIARCLAHGTAIWARDSRLTSAQGGRAPALSVLIIKDGEEEGPDGEDDALARRRDDRRALRERIQSVFDAAFRAGDVQLEHLADGEQWHDPSWWDRTILEDNPEGNLVEVIDGYDHSTSNKNINNYDIIIMDVEHQTEFLGASVVHWLDTVFDDRRRDQPRDRDEPEKPRHKPALFVLSRIEHAGRVAQCMMLGAEAYIPMDRLFQLPAQMTLARVGRRHLENEPRNSKPNFRSLYSLLPRDLNELKGHTGPELVRGDDLDGAWIRRLPKADLHFHIGTSISLNVIAALAFNTTGYLLKSTGYQEAGDGTSRPRYRDTHRLVKQVCEIVALADLLKREGAATIDGNVLTPPKALWVAAWFILRPKDPRSGKGTPLAIPEQNLLDKVVDLLTLPERPFHKFETCSLLVAAIAGFPEFSRETNLEECPYAFPWRYFERLSEEWSAGIAGDLGVEIQTMLDYYMRRVDRNWHDNLTRDHRPKPVGPPISAVLQSLRDHAAENVGATHKALQEEFKKLRTGRWSDDIRRSLRDDAQWKHGMKPPKDTDQTIEPARLGAGGSASGISGLAEFVAIPKTGGPAVSGEMIRERTLQRYLWGAGLLGAEHLQYAENILLAGADLVRQAVAENIVYSEVRCSTTGYCEGGLTPHDATDLLCLSFDIAAAYFGTGERPDFQDASRAAPLPRRWVRTNILLGAKRHKPGRDFRDVVSLLESYLRRGMEAEAKAPYKANGKVEAEGRHREKEPKPRHKKVEAPGAWWERARVVGFDMSGDESARIEEVEKLIQPLFDLCSPITIHAGEAHTAQNIWDAVYKLGAQRIGHGLRLRENDVLLAHCVSRGICMELCPISNSFTNLFDELPERPKSRDQAGSRQIYPIHYFLHAGLDVCVNTDNRSLHPPGQGTLTDDYLQAARMVGGLTRWEILKIIKAGFKNAFLPKEQVGALLRHVDYEIYQLIADDPNSQSFASPWGGRES